MLQTSSKRLVRPNEVTITEKVGLGLHATTPQFYIFHEGQWVGYISRGHSTIWPDHRGKGYFSLALTKLEEFERNLFASGRFPEYRDAIIQQVGVGAESWIPSLEILSDPHHLEYWRYPLAAAYFIRKGYKLTRKSAIELGLMKITGSPDEIAEALVKRNDELTDKALFILAKRVK